MTRVGFVGLGSMGGAMVGHLLDEGHEVVVWNRSPEAVDALVERGATRAASVSDALQTGLVLSMLSNESVVFDLFDTAVLEAAPRGTVHVNMATVGAAAATRLAALHADAGVGYVAAPVLGRPPAAGSGALTVLAAGDPELVEGVRPLLSTLGRRVWDVGTDPSSANVVKIGVNYLIIHALQALSESITLLESRDIDTAMFVELLGDSLFPGVVYSGYGTAIASSTYSPAGFTTELGFKDLMLALDAARASDVVLPTSSALRGVFEKALDDGQAELDWASIAEVTRAASGRPAR
ncbi:NAD(P)-dependent oxidoreductase [Herbiconiux sp. CPCC 205716]|uniref:NAD(P)-dependent oxidoreductase n=1 Tax=Herbiconiux gentiana TaxID=2970912 RepID=A0ABT2GGZ5_9MICO|nr:NAD(P)-dependent oxidoreductase [Herbiconiux gentiana]MCS5714061.1 NAD(P)-dependent oxidoreductase [Herbiconiux gentiana]